MFCPSVKAHDPDPWVRTQYDHARLLWEMASVDTENTDARDAHLVTCHLHIASNELRRSPRASRFNINESKYGMGLSHIQCVEVDKGRDMGPDIGPVKTTNKKAQGVAKAPRYCSLALSFASRKRQLDNAGSQDKTSRTRKGEG